MDTALKLFTLERTKKTEAKSNETEKLIEDIRNVCRMLDSAYNRFQFEKDDDLVEATIYEMEALKARYRYLIRLAKENQIENAALTGIWDADGRMD